PTTTKRSWPCSRGRTPRPAGSCASSTRRRRASPGRRSPRRRTCSRPTTRPARSPRSPRSCAGTPASRTTWAGARPSDIMKALDVKTVRLGRTELEVSPIAFGTWQLGGEWGDFDEDEGIAAIRQARELGINLFDTAQGYGFGASERVLGKALRNDLD